MIYIVQFNRWLEQPHKDIYSNEGELIEQGQPLVEWYREVHHSKEDAEGYCSNPAEAMIVEIVKTPETKRQWINFINSRTWEYSEIADRAAVGFRCRANGK